MQKKFLFENFKNMKLNFLNLIPSALTIIYVTYGSWFLINEIFCSILPFTVIFTAAIVCLIVVLRIAPPEPTAVEAVIGKELHLENSETDYVMKTVAHRGAGLDAPENSLAAFKLMHQNLSYIEIVTNHEHLFHYTVASPGEFYFVLYIIDFNQCSQKGCDAIEFDVCLTKDGIPIVFHDKTLERMANSNLIVSESTWEQLANIDISVNHSLKGRFVNTNIPTLDQAVQQLLNDGQRMFIDIKDNNYKMVGIIQELFKKYPELVSRAVVTSFFPNIIYWIRRGNPEIVGALSYRPYAFSYDSFKYPEGKGAKRTEAMFKFYLLCLFDTLLAWATPRIIYYLLGLSVILLHKDSISGEVILGWRGKGVRVIAWSVNSPIEKQHLARNLKISYLTDTLTGDNTVHNQPS